MAMQAPLFSQRHWFSWQVVLVVMHRTPAVSIFNHCVKQWKLNYYYYYPLQFRNISQYFIRIAVVNSPTGEWTTQTYNGDWINISKLILIRSKKRINAINRTKGIDKLSKVRKKPLKRGREIETNQQVKFHFRGIWHYPWGWDVLHRTVNWTGRAKRQIWIPTGGKRH